MQKNYATHLLILGLMVGGLGTASTIYSASADDAEGNKMEQRHLFMENITRTVENIENGVIITMTTEDPTTLEKLQNITEFPPHGGEGGFLDEVDQGINLLDNGVQIKLTSEDPEMVEKLQNMPEPGMHGPRGHGPFGMFMNDKVTRTVETIDNGVVITLTTDDAEMLKKLQEIK